MPGGLGCMSELFISLNYSPNKTSCFNSKLNSKLTVLFGGLTRNLNKSSFYLL